MSQFLRLGIISAVLVIAGLTWILCREKQVSHPSASAPAAAPTTQLQALAPAKPALPTIENKGAVAPQKPEAPTCFRMSFHHKPIPSHSDEETCSHHRNLIKLGHEKINPASLCVRVNGIPVKHQKASGAPDELVIGAIAGPRAKITAQFCTGKSLCADPCKIPRDEFMAAIGGSGGDEEDSDNEEARAPASAGAGHWDAGDKGEKGEKDAQLNDRVDSEVRKTLAEGNELLNDDGTYLFKDWVKDWVRDSGKEGESPACAGGNG